MAARKDIRLMNKSKYSSTKIFLWLFVCMFLILVATCTVIFLDVTGDSALSRFRDHQLLLTEKTADSISEYVASSLSTFADLAVVAHVSSPNFPVELRKLYGQEGGKLASIAQFDKKGKNILRYPAGSPRWEPGERQRQLLMQSMSPILAADTEHNCFAVVAPILRGGRFEGAVGGLIDFSLLGKTFLQSLTSGRGCEAFLFNERGVLLTHVCSASSPPGHSAGDIAETSSPEFGHIIEKIIAGEKGFEEYKGVGERDGRELKREMVIAYAPIRLPQGRWTLAIATPRSEATGYFVKSPLTIVSLASASAIALAAFVILFYMLGKRRKAANIEADALRDEQKLATRLEESEERYKTLVQNLPSPVVIMQDARIKFANPFFYSLTGYSPEEISAETFDPFSLIHEDDRPLAMENTAKLFIGEGIEQPREIRFIKKTGEEVTGLTFSSIIHFDGRPAIETVMVDITSIKNMERELGSMKKRLEYLLDNAPVMIFSLDDMGRFAYANKETLRTTGYQFDDWVGKPFAPIVHPDDLALAVAKFEEGRRGARRRDYKLRIRNARGELRVLHIISGTILDDEQFAGSLIIARDITEQQRLQQAVRETRDRLANIIGNAGDAIITLDNEGKVVSWNKSAEMMFHFVEPSTFRKPLHAMLNADQARLSGLFERVTHGETIRDVEITCSREETRLDTLFTFSPIREVSGAVAGISCFAKDITGRRRLESQLERDKKFIDDLIENANVLIAAANEKGKLVIFNRRFEEVTGFKKEEALTKDPLELFVPLEYRELVSTKVAAVRSGKPLLEIEVPIVSKEGKTLTVTWNVAAVKLPSGNAAVVVVGQDVTEQRRMHEELAQSKKLASIGELVSGVAHELNNPLTIVMGYSELLTAEQRLSEKHRDMAQKILEAAARSKRIVENLLAFARKKKLQKHTANINEIIENTLSLREHNFAVNNVTIVRKYDDTLPPTYADSHQLQQVFLNLINNAFDAMSAAHGRGRLEVRTYGRNSEIVVEIIDDGPGVPESIQDKIFDPFFTTKEVGKGTGLGMSLSYGIVREHGGKIYLDKSYRNGARFILEFPVTSAPAAVNVV